MHIKFLGDGSAEIIGIPARDLTVEDWDALAPEQQAHALASGLYKAVEAVVAPIAPDEPIHEQEAN